MKKSVVVLFLFTVFFSCKPKETVTSTKLDNKTEVAIKGNWRIVSVSFPGSDYLKVTSFNIADAKCFEGSEWSFVSNNNKGSMLLNKGNCPAYSSNITWYVNKDGFMVMKFLTDGVKAKHTSSGYILTVVNVNETSFQLVDKVNVGGKMVDLTYNFERK
ncbi:lipocalin family protein [Flavobacterium cucumis]|uniref:Lipocalin-like domain-containing protein n=1 Tax=Flavobacterium cucumis TaxID=416016 RepID=A0A1M7ZWT5_9FLAO|nr:lipocalin family protein [Flavobacterium cucumis]SHO73067.1 Lipocalin-like domain-containing protein [Flavobacterium cucumis]